MLRFGLLTRQPAIKIAYYKMLHDIAYWRDLLKELMNFPVPQEAKCCFPTSTTASQKL
jgi:hypothetical protein